RAYSAGAPVSGWEVGACPGRLCNQPGKDPWVGGSTLTAGVVPGWPGGGVAVLGSAGSAGAGGGAGSWVRSCVSRAGGGCSGGADRKSTRLNSSHVNGSYA